MKTNKNLKKLRRKLDLLDNAFLNLIKKRTLLVNQVLQEKKYKKVSEERFSEIYLVKREQTNYFINHQLIEVINDI